MEKGDLRGAEAQYRAVLKENERSHVAWNNLGLALMRSNRLQEAVKALERAVALNPRSAIYHNNLGAAYERAGQIAKARTMYQEALKLDPKLEDAQKNLQRLASRK